MNPYGKSFGKKLLSSPPPRSRQLRKTIMENKNPDVKFILGAFVGSLMALTTEGDLLLEDELGGQLRTRLTRSCQKNHQAKSSVFSDSMLCSGTHDQRPVTATFKSRWTKRRQKDESNASKGINDRFLDCEFNVNPGFISEQLLARIKHHVPSTVDITCTPDLIKSGRWRCTRTGSSFKESEVDNQLHKNDNLKTQNAQELSDYASRVRPGLGITTESRTDIGTQNVFTDFSHKQENLVTPWQNSPQAGRPHEKRRRTVSTVSLSIMSRQTFVASSSRSEIIWMTCNRETSCSNIEKTETSSLDQRNGRRGERRANRKKC